MKWIKSCWNIPRVWTSDQTPGFLLLFLKSDILLCQHRPKITDLSAWRFTRHCQIVLVKNSRRSGFIYSGLLVRKIIKNLSLTSRCRSLLPVKRVQSHCDYRLRQITSCMPRFQNKSCPVCLYVWCADWGSFYFFFSEIFTEVRTLVTS